jgi:hypothetical protein
MKSNTRYCIIIVLLPFLLLAASIAAGVGLAVYTSNNFYTCDVTKITQHVCKVIHHDERKQQSQYLIDITMTLQNNFTGVTSCENTRTCNDTCGISIGNTFDCRKINQQLFLVGSHPFAMYVAIGGFLFMACMLVVVIGLISKSYFKDEQLITDPQKIIDYGTLPIQNN